MRFVVYAALGTAFTFWMTTLGAALVFFFASHTGARLERLCMGFAAGVMSAAAVFSLLIPAMEQTAAQGGVPWRVAVTGFVLGGAVILAADSAIRRSRAAALASEEARRLTLLYSAVTLHNIPEGMAVGLAFALAAQGGAAELAAACALALGIGVQNLPEGAALALPLRQSGMSRKRSFLLGAASGAVEPVFGIAAALTAACTQAMLPWLMSFAAGAMILVVSEEMIPAACTRRDGTAALMIGYALMMALDAALG